MAANVVFDTHGYIKRLTEAGVEPRAAEVIAEGQVEFLNENVATKVDIAQLETKLTAVIVNSRFKIIVSLLGAMTGFGALLLAALKLL